MVLGSGCCAFSKYWISILLRHYFYFSFVSHSYSDSELDFDTTEIGQWLESTTGFE